MDTGMEVKVLWGSQMEANPDQRDKGAGEGQGTEAAREGASGGSLRCSAEPSESEALMRRPNPKGEPARSGKPKSIGPGWAYRRRRRHEALCSYLERPLGFRPGAVVIEDERTR
jgi:hypothetical protein